MKMNTMKSEERAGRRGGAAIGVEEIHEAEQTRLEYKNGKANLDQRIVDSEQWYKLRNWELIEHSDSEVQPVSAWLFNCLASRHADAMDAFPAPTILPREIGDKEEAQKLSSIIPLILEQNDFEQVYSDVIDYKNRTGTGIYGCFWDSSKLNGLGDINIVQADILSLYWEPGKKDIQDSANFFAVESVDKEALISQYPQLRDKLSGENVDTVQYVHDDQVDTSNQVAVVSWYYKQRVGSRTIVQYVKYCGDDVLYASEDDSEHPEYRELGFYYHGLYPYIFDPLFRVAGTPAGFGYVDIGKSPQEYIDRGNQAAMESMLANASPRYLSKLNGGINREQFADMTQKIVDFTGNPEDIIQIKSMPISSTYTQIIQDKINEMKETLGNRDASNGGTTGGVTAAAAIAAMQEAGAKLPRDASKASYRAFRRLILMVIELMRQFYDKPRCFRILGEEGQEEFTEYSNAGIIGQRQDAVGGIDVGDRIPLFDIKVSAQKANPYSQMAQNELAMQLYDKGFFNPQMADQAMACLKMMDFDGKQEVMNTVSENGGIFAAMQQQIAQLSAIVDQMLGTNFKDEAAAGGAPMPRGSGGGLDLEGVTGESAVTANARARTAAAPQPR